MFGKLAGSLDMTRTYGELMSRMETSAGTTAAGTDTRSTRTHREVRRGRLSDCCCGQQLDMCARAHCPRCGRSIAHR